MTSNIIFNNINPFEEEKVNNVHIRFQQRNARSYITIIEGLSNKLDLPSILKSFKKTFHCNGTIKDNIFKLSGDQRQNVEKFLIKEKLYKKDQIIVHGF